MTWLPWVAAAAGTTTLFAAAAGPFWWLARQHRAMPIPTGWQPGELATITAELRAVPAPPVPCTHRHCAGCAEPARTTKVGARHHRGRHTLDALPDELRYVLSLATVTERAREIARQLDPLRHRVWSNPAAWRQRVGRQVWLGHGTAIGGTTA